MTKAKTTKRALLMSVLSMMLCIAMLVGSTFAWFTDSVTSGKNKIVAGNLDVEMDYAVLNDDGSIKEWKSVEGESLFDENALWEPGYTQVVYLRVHNAGTLSLSYKLSVLKKGLPDGSDGEKYGISLDENGEQQRFWLSEVLRFGADTKWDGKTTYTRAEARKAADDNAGDLLSHTVKGAINAGEEDKYIALVVYMPEEAGNKYNHISGVPSAVPYINLDIRLQAQQKVDESDSFGNDYDKTQDFTLLNPPVSENPDPDVKDTFADYDTATEFTVTTENDLLKLQDLVANGKSFEGKTVKLGNSITLTQGNWTPIGNTANPFKGTFDGQNNIISNLKITSVTGNRAGFFGVVENATIKDLTLGGSIDVTGDLMAVAGFSPESRRTSRFENCTNEVAIKVTGTDNCVYAIASGGSGEELYALYIDRCTNNAAISISGNRSYAASITMLLEVPACTVRVTGSQMNGEVTASNGAKATQNAGFMISEL